VIINLLTNACHALDDGGELTIATRYEGRRVAVEVADSGRGIPTEDLPSIFEPFFTTKTPGEGTGLGLSIVKKIVDFHSGTIMVESETGKGTTFSITLPTGHDERSE
jgi:signal transduction histidine kinase